MHGANGFGARLRVPYRALLSTAALTLAAVLMAGRAVAQTVNPGFFITNGQVSTQVVLDSTLYMGGSFSFVGPVTGAGVPVDSITALPAANYPRVNGTVIASVPDGAGGWYIGGQFTSVGDVPRANLAHVLADLSVAAWDPGANGIVRALLFQDSVLYVGGDFLNLGGAPRNRIGALDTLGAITPWNPGANSSVRAFAAGPTFLYAGGQFTNIGGLNRNRIAALDYATGAVAPFWDANANGSVLALSYDATSNLLYLGGQFTFVDAQARLRIAAVSGANGAATVWNSGSDNAVFAIVANGPVVYVAGQFANIGSSPRNRIAALSAATGLATSFNPNADNVVQSLVLSGSTLYAGGDFLNIGGQSRSRVAALDTGSGLATAWNPVAFSTVSTLAMDQGQVFVGGSFNGIGGTPRNNLAAFNSRTGELLPWDPNANNQVQVLLAAPDRMLVGGNFTQLSGQPRANLAAVDFATGAPTAWAPSVNGQVSALALAGSRLYVGGLFTSLGGQPRVNLGALDMSTALAHPWTADTDGQVFALDASTAAIRVGGDFTTLDGAARNFIGAVDAGSSAVTAWVPDATGIVRAIVPACDRVYVGGFFTSIGGQVRNRIAAVDLNAGLALPWDPDANGAVFSIVPKPGAVYLGGIMTTVGASTRNRAAAVDPATGAVSPWDPNSNGTVRSLAADAEHVFIGGVFSTLAGTPAGNLAAVTPDASIVCPVITLTPPPIADGVAGSAYAATITATGGTSPYCYAVTSGVLPNGIVLDPATGQFSGAPTDAGVSAFTVTATDAHGCAGTESYAITVTWAPGVSIVRQPSNVVAGESITPSVRVHLADAGGNSLPGQSVSLALVGTGTLTGGAAIAADANGIVLFPGLSVNLAGGKQLVASGAGQSPATSVAFTVSPAAAANLSYAVQPTNVVAGASIAPAVNILVRDAFTNPVSGTTVRLALVGTGTLTGGDSLQSDVNGIASFAALTVDLIGSKQLRASSGALPTSTSSSFTVSPGPAASLAYTVQPANVVAGVAVAPAVQVRVLDAFGNGVPATGVTLALVGTGTLTGGGSVTSDSQGLSTFNNVRVDLVGSKQLNAGSGALPIVTSNAFAVSAAAAATLSIAVQPADVVAGVEIAPAVQVQVRDAFTNPVAGTSVTFALLGGGTLTGGGAVVSNASGVASFNNLRVDLAGSKQLRASSGVLPTATSNAFTVSAAAAANLSFAVQPSNTVAGVSVAPAVQVLVRDAFTNPVAGTSVSLALVGTGVLSGGAAVASDAGGIASFSGLSVTLVGSKQLTASSGALPTATSTAFTISSAAAATLSFTVQPANAVAGASVAPAVQVLVRDAFTNPVAGSSVALALVGTGTLSGDAAVASNASGIASFNALNVDLVGSKQLTASSGALPNATSNAFTISAAAPAALAYTVQPSDVVAGVNLAPAVQVRVRDAFTNLVPGASVSLTLVGTGTLTGGGATLTNATGVASFGGVSVDLAGSKQLNASCLGVTPLASSAFTVSAAGAAALSFTAQPTNVVAGVSIAPAVRVKVADAFGNAVSGTSVSLALIGGGTLTGGGATASDASGLATFSGLSVNLAGSKQLRASSGVLPTSSSSSFTVSAAAAASLSISVQPANVIAGVAIAPAVQVRVADAFGNNVSGTSVSMALVGAGTLTGGGGVASNASGIASFSNLRVDLAGAKQLTASSGALPAATTNSFTVSAAAASALSFAVPPSGVVAGVAIAPAVQVRVVDTFGNLVSGSSVSLALVGSGTLTGGGAKLSDGLGLATFNAVSVNLAGLKQLRASSGVLPVATSSGFTVSAAAPAALSFTTQPLGVVAGVNIAPAVQVKVADAFGNAVSGQSVSLALVGAGALTGAGAATSDASGISSFASLSVDLAGSKQLRASSGALPFVNSASFNVSAAAASAVSFLTQPANVVAGVAIAPAVQVRVADAFGNGVTGTAVTLALVGTGALSGGAAVASNASGVVTFSSLSLTLVGDKQLIASSGALPVAASASFTVSAGAPATLEYLTQPTNVVAGVALAPPVQIRVKDAFGNVVPGGQASLSLQGPGTLTGGGATATDASGSVTFADLRIDVAGMKSLMVSCGGATALQSSPFTVFPAAPATLTFTGQPSNVVAGTPMITPVRARVADAFGNGVTGVPITLALAGPGTLLGGDATPSAVNGIATFVGLVIRGSGSMQLLAKSGTLPNGTSNSFTVTCPAIALSPSVLPDAGIGASYLLPIQAAGGKTPYTFVLASGALPPGMELGSAGVISGTSNAAGSYSFTLNVTDGNGCSISRTYGLPVLGAPRAIADLKSLRTVAGSGNDGRVQIQLTFTPPPFTSAVEVYRAPFGGYPRYDESGGVAPPTPSYPPGAPWQLTAITASGQSDKPPTRDAWSYVVFAKSGTTASTVSPVSNQAVEVLDYLLGDVSNETDRGVGDNRVGDADLSLLGAHYGVNAAAMDAANVRYLDIGPTLDRTLDTRPVTDGRVDFEDLFVLATGYSAVPGAASALAVADAAAHDAQAPERITLQAPSLVEAGETVSASLGIEGAGRVQGLTAQLSWDASVVQPLEVSSSAWIQAQNGVVLSARPGNVDVALLGVRERGLSGAGDLASVRFRALRVGDPHIRLDGVEGRDAANRTLSASALEAKTNALVPAHTLLLAPAPNPARGPVLVTFALAHAGRVDLAIYSVDGRRVRTLAGGEFNAGAYQLTWTGEDDARRTSAPGVYFAQLVTQGKRFTQKIVHLQ